MSVKSPADPVTAYLADLRRRACALPRPRRDELVGEIEEHLREAIPPEASEAEIRAALDSLGDPALIVEEERDRLELRPVTASWREWLALALMTVGSLLLPLIGWAIGAAFLWSSRVWSERDKLLGTLVVPGGLLAGFAIPLIAGNAQTCSGSATAPGQPEQIHCTGGQSTAVTVVWIAVELFLVLGPIITALHLARRASRAGYVTA